MDDNNTKVVELKKIVADFRDARGWKKFHAPRNLATSIVLEASELLELFQWDLRAFSAAQIKKDKDRMEEIKNEMADVIVYSLSLADILGIDVTDAIIKKMEHNAKKYSVVYFNKDVQDLKHYKKIKKLYRSGKVVAK
jgi:NTP pyrophosphatase (non-canonical NTP hydrolase)